MRGNRWSRVLRPLGLIVALLLAVSASNAAWEQMPSPDLSLSGSAVSYHGQTWFHSAGWCGPFLVADDNGHLYIAHASSYENYDHWLRYDIEDETYTALTPPTNLYPFSFCNRAYGSGGYADGKILANFPTIGIALAQYNVATDQWTWAAQPLVNAMSATVAADRDHERLYWYDALGSAGRVDPEIGLGSLESGNVMGSMFANPALAVIDNKAYFTGGIYANYWPTYFLYQISPPDAGSQKWSTIYNFATQSVEAMSKNPEPAAFVGAGVANGKIHFVGSQVHIWWDSYGKPFSFWFMDYHEIQLAEIYHYIYDPGDDAWTELENDLPPQCMPWSVAQSGDYLYGLFTCPTQPTSILLYRSDIVNTTVTPTTTTTTLPPDDDTDDDSLDDDTSDDDISDDDTTGDDTSDDDFTAPAAGDDDDTVSGNCCG